MKSLGRFATTLTGILTALTPIFATADYYVARNGTNSDEPPYTSWATAASNIQHAVNAATNRATVWIGAETYSLPPNPTNYAGANNVVYINKPLTLRGETGNPADVIINGGGAHRGIAATYSTIATLTLDGLTVSNGYVNGGTGTGSGGGVYIAPGNGWTSVIRNCVFADNTVTGAVSQGGGLWAKANNHMVVMVSGCTFQGNEAAGAGGTGGGAFFGAGVYYHSGGGVITDSLFENNYAGLRGGGLRFDQVGSRLYSLTNCVIRGNTSYRGGGGIYQWPAGVRMWNCLLHDNFAGTFAFSVGGAVYMEKSPDGLHLYNCTIVSNRANYLTGGIQTGEKTDHLMVFNSIVYSNLPANFSLGGTSISHFAYSCFTPTNLPGGNYQLDGGNIDDAPSFSDVPGRDFRLQKDSPGINAGTNQPAWMAGALDLDGNPRIDPIFGQVDMGCYEYMYRGSVITIQ